ncbi:HalOD1 output domain-containing protein [Halomarina halobia]|uniref:HalOD1 output domain-containing protein n=1 Tax=Halomarina halobia TaxID=3033386 RepID=UPI0023E80927|nr:HalOD1 output domain-containing protein [Halomarina sp. PSR21]
MPSASRSRETHERGRGRGGRRSPAARRADRADGRRRAGIDATALEQRLYEAVDPDALEQLFARRPDGSRREWGRTSFDLAGCRVVVDTREGVTAYRLAD